MGELTQTVQAVLSREGAAVASLREFNDAQLQVDPARATWPATLIVELALKTATPQELKEHYGFSDEEWQALRYNPTFIAELADMCETVRKEGVSFRKKAQLQAEEMLKTSWQLVHGPASEVPAAVKARLIETTFRIAGYDDKGNGSGAGGGAQFNIQVNLGG